MFAIILYPRKGLAHDRTRHRQTSGDYTKAKRWKFVNDLVRGRIEVDA